MKTNVLNLCIIHPNRSNPYSETFIRAHIERLPARIKVLNGGFFPTYQGDRHLLSWLVCLLVKSFNGFSTMFPDSQVGQASKSLAWFMQNRALARFLIKHRVDGVLAEYGPTGACVTESCQQARVPLIVHFHGFDAYNQSVLEQYQNYQNMFHRVAAFIVVSRAMKRHLIDLHAPPERVFYNPCGVDCTLFHGACPESNPPTFVAVGRFIDNKAPHLALLAFKRVAETIPEASFTLIGDGPLLEASRHLARALKLDHRVEFAGVLPNSQVASIMQRSRAFVQHSVTTSYGHSEGTPVAILEAGASGLPVVSTRAGGIQDVVLHNETGFLVEEGDVEGMADHMVALAKAPMLAKIMGQKAREHICTHYSIGKSIDRLHAIITEAIRGYDNPHH